ncbi:efflux RND transporter periplasmic adaptor subunit [Tropicimonas sp. S265A]|uniref:efflux RND transporter periplasmic adaptor subunit n=1 Tax=Tropicimonas sp. S265A TaxID=3415134 RepID=UPI003C7BE9E5
MRRFPMPAFAIVLITACALSFPVSHVAQAQGRPAAVVTELVETRTLAETLPVFGQIVASRDSAVAARVAGIVDTVAVLVGDRVKAGDLLAELDTELTEIEYDQALAARSEAEAGIAVAEAQLARARDTLSRTEGLRDTAAFSSGRFEDLRAELAQAQGQLAQAQARFSNAEASLAEVSYTLSRAKITAPFDAVVLSVEADPGQFISVGAEVARLLDISALEVEAQVPAQFIAAVETGVDVRGETEQGIELDLTVRAVLPTESTATRTRPVRFTVDLGALNGSVALGQSLTLQVPIARPRDALSLPKDALVQGAQGWTVFVNADGTAQPRPVTIGVAMGDRFEVLGGLSEGDEVVVRGNERLRPGQAIQPAGGPPPASN